MRTDRTFVCTACRVRCWPVRRCPACGETTSLFDLRAYPDAIGRAMPARGSLVVAGLLGAATASALGVAGWGVAVGAAGLAEAAAIFAIPTGILSMIAIPARYSASALGAAKVDYEVLASPVVRDATVRASYRGHVKAAPGSLLTAPLSGRPCVAWRLIGEGTHGALDDASAVPFGVDGGPGSTVVEVDASIATVEIQPPLVEPRDLRVTTEMGAWLRARGVAISGEPLLVLEAVLAEGDGVEVIGTKATRTRAEGYRGGATREVLVDLPGSPLIVRSPPSAPPGADARVSASIA